VRRALEDGTITEERWASYHKLRREIRHLEMQKDSRVRREEQARWKKVTRIGRENMARKYGKG
jgi:ribosome biogenesis GTPase